MEPRFKQALDFAERAHRGQLDAGGVDYVEHVRGVVAGVQKILASIPMSVMSDEQREETLEIAALHDTMEDTGTTRADLLEAGFSLSVVRGVERLTGRPPGVTYYENILAIAHEDDFRVIVVKLADNQHNSLPERIAQLPTEKRGIERRYEQSMRTLSARLAAAIQP